MFIDHFVANLLLSLSVKELRKSASRPKLLQLYDKVTKSVFKRKLHYLDWLWNLLYNKSSTNRNNGVCATWTTALNCNSMRCNWQTDDHTLYHIRYSNLLHVIVNILRLTVLKKDATNVHRTDRRIDRHNNNSCGCKYLFCSIVKFFTAAACCLSAVCLSLVHTGDYSRRCGRGFKSTEPHRGVRTKQGGWGFNQLTSVPNNDFFQNKCM